MKLKHLCDNLFEINHNKKVFNVRILNLYETIGLYTDVLKELRDNNIKLENRPSLKSVYHTLLPNKNYHKNGVTYFNIMHYYDEKIIEYILNNRNYFNNLYNSINQ